MKKPATDKTIASRVREAVRRLEAIRSVLKRESNRANNNYGQFQGGEAEGLRLAIMEIDHALLTDRDSAIARCV